MARVESPQYRELRFGNEEDAEKAVTDWENMSTYI